jgi:hypothetical protein
MDCFVDKVKGIIMISLKGPFSTNRGLKFGRFFVRCSSAFLARRLQLELKL